MLRTYASFLANIAPTNRNIASSMRDNAGINLYPARSTHNIAPTLRDYARTLPEHAGILTHHARTLAHHARILSNHAPILVRVAPTLVRGALTLVRGVLTSVRVVLSIVQVACFHANDSYFTGTSGNFDGGTRMPHVSLSASPLLDDNAHLVIA